MDISRTQRLGATGDLFLLHQHIVICSPIMIFFPGVKGGAGGVRGIKGKSWNVRPFFMAFKDVVGLENGVRLL